MSNYLKSFIVAHKDALFDVMIIACLGLLPVTWFRGDFLISAGDFVFLPNGLQTCMNSLYLWNSWGPSFTGAGLVPYELFRAFTSIAGLSTVTSEKVWFYLSFTFCCFSMYYLTSTLVKGKGRRLTSLVSAFFYTMIPYVVGSNFLLPLPTTTLFYSSLPLLLALYIRGINERHGLKGAFIVCLIWILTTTSAYVDFPYAVVTWVILGTYYIFYIATNRGSRLAFASASRFTLFLLALWSLINMYWLLPVVFSSSSLFQGASVSGISSLDWLRSWSANLLDVMRLRGFFGLTLKTQADYYAPWSTVYSTSVFVDMSFMVPVLASASILTGRKNKYVLYFCSLALFGLFLIKGPYPPLGEVNVFLYNAFWPLQTLRSVYMRFLPMITLSFAFLIGYTAGHLYPANLLYRFKRKSAIKLTEISRIIAVGAIIFLLFGVYLYPLWTGEVIYSGGQVVPSARVKIPEYYTEAANWLSQDNEDYNIMSLPMANIKGYEEFSWDSGYAGAGITFSVLNKPVIGSADIFNGLSGFVASRIIQNASEGIGKILSLMRVKYVLLHNDADWQFITKPNYGGFIYTSQEASQSILNSFNGLLLEKSLSKLDFYQNQYQLVPTIYSAGYATLVSGGFDQMAAVAGRNDFAPDETVLLLTKDLNSKQQFTLENEWGINEKNAYSTETLTNFFVPKNGNYTILMAVSNVDNVQNRTFTGRIDMQDVTFYPDSGNYTSEEPSYVYLSVRPLYLNLGYHSLSMDSKCLNLSVSDGWANPINWNSTFKDTQVAARFYSFPPWKAVVKTDGSEPNDTISFSSLNEAPYLFPPFSSREWNSADSTLVYLLTQNESVTIDTVLADNERATDLNVFWETGWMGMTTKPVTFPIVIPPHQKAIIQINHKASMVTLISNPPKPETIVSVPASVTNNSLYSLFRNPTISYTKIAPTQYIAHIVNATSPFFLVFGVLYDPGWAAYYGDPSLTSTLFAKSVPDEYHFVANGYMNTWYVNSTGSFDITLYFKPQSMLYYGAFVSAGTFIIGVIYIANRKIRSRRIQKYAHSEDFIRQNSE